MPQGFEPGLLVAVLSLTMAGCDGEIVVKGTVYSEDGGRVAGAKLLLADHQIEGWFVDCMKQEEKSCLRAYRNSLSEEDGTYVTAATVAGNGRHDFWIVAWRDDMGELAQRVWQGKGWPDETFEADLLLPAE